MKFTKLLPRYAAPLATETLEAGPGGLPIVQNQGLNTNKAVNFSGFQVDTSGNVTNPGTITSTSTVTGPTGSFAIVNVTTAEVNATAGTGGTAVFSAATVGAAAGGPAATTQHGWVKINVAGVACWVPEWQ